MPRRTQRILAAAEPRGDAEKLEAVLDRAESLNVDAVGLLGNLTSEAEGGDRYRGLFKALGSRHIPTFWIPGPTDAPMPEYLRESFNIEIVYPFLHGVHGSMAMSSDYVVFAGMGGEIDDDPEAEREEHKALRYPGWEVEYRLKVLMQLTHEYQRVFLFTTIPAHKGLRQPGSEVLAELINAYRPRVALVAGGEGVRKETLGKSLIVLPGTLARGEFAIVDLRERAVEPGQL